MGQNVKMEMARNYTAEKWVIDHMFVQPKICTKTHRNRSHWRLIAIGGAHEKAIHVCFLGNPRNPGGGELRRRRKFVSRSVTHDRWAKSKNCPYLANAGGQRRTAAGPIYTPGKCATF